MQRQVQDFRDDPNKTHSCGPIDVIYDITQTRETFKYELKIIVDSRRTLNHCF